LQQLAFLEYGGGMQKVNPESNVIYSAKGFQQVGNGIRIDLDSYNDLVCWTINFNIIHIRASLNI